LLQGLGDSIGGREPATKETFWAVLGGLNALDTFIALMWKVSTTYVGLAWFAADRGVSVCRIRVGRNDWWVPLLAEVNILLGCRYGPLEQFVEALLEV
jgi:hypothetical protein